MPLPATRRVFRSRIWLRRLAWLCMCYAVLVVFISCTHMADYLILHPTTNTVEAGNAERELLPAPGGGQLELWHARSPGAETVEPVAFLMLFVGNADRVDRWVAPTARSWGSTPVQVTGMNYPGFGGSTGPASLAAIPSSAAAAYDTLRARAGSRPIFIQANSVGTTAALYLLAHRDVAGAIIHNPPPLRRLILGSYGWWNLWLIAGPVAATIPSELDSIANARHATAPALFILSLNDEVVPHAYQSEIYNAYSGPKHLLEFPHTHNTGMDASSWAKVREEFLSIAPVLQRNAAAHTTP